MTLLILFEIFRYFLFWASGFFFCAWLKRDQQSDLLRALACLIVAIFNAIVLR